MFRTRMKKDRNSRCTFIQRDTRQVKRGQGEDQGVQSEGQKGGRCARDRNGKMIYGIYQDSLPIGE